MLTFRTTGLAALLLSAASLLLASAPVRAGEKKKESIFTEGKPIPLKLKDGKVSYDGELTDKDVSVKDHYYKIFTVTLESGKTYKIDMRHKDDPKFDSFLFLEDSDKKQLAFNDDADGLDSRIIQKITKSGTYRIITTTFPPKQEGKFILEIALANEKEAKEASLGDRLTNFAKLSAKEQKELVLEITKSIQGKGAAVTMIDARNAYQLATALEATDVEAARETYKAFIKVMQGASNPQVAGTSKVFDSALKKIEMIGKEIEITGKTTDGKEFNLKNLKGKVVLVDFWATWCGPCVAEIPNIVEAHKKYNAKGFEVIGVSLDRGDEEIVKFLEAKKLPWQSINVADSRKLADRYKVNAIPQPILVGRDGRVVSMNARGPQLEILLERLTSAK